MTVMIVLGAIVLFFVLLFSLHLKLDVSLFDTLTVRAGIGPIMLKLSPKKERVINPRDFSYKKHQKRLKKDRKLALKKAEKKRRTAEKKAEQKAEEERLKKDAEKAGEAIKKKKFPFGFILALVKFVIRELDVFIGYFRTEIVALHVTVGGKDAAAVGKTYGTMAAAVPCLVEFVDRKTRMKKLKPNAVSVNADFLLKKTKIDVHFRLKLRLGNIVRVGIHALVWFIKQKISESKSAAFSAETKVSPTKSKEIEQAAE